MTVSFYSSAQLAEIRRLSTALAERVLEVLNMQVGIAPEPAAALKSAAALLRDNGVALPPVLVEVLQTLAMKSESQMVPLVEMPEYPSNVIGLGFTRYRAQGQRKAQRS